MIPGDPVFGKNSPRPWEQSSAAVRTKESTKGWETAVGEFLGLLGSFPF
jgi:hypothetical protein